LADDLADAEAATAAGQKLHLRIALDYSSRDAILQAVAASEVAQELTREIFGRLVTGPDAGDVDLLIRSGGEKRLSDFLLWECAYAELCFTDRMWPDFDGGDLAAAVNDFRGRERRFGAVGSAPMPAARIPSAA
jgi:undecaprenyl diphosphate synthase